MRTRRILVGAAVAIAVAGCAGSAQQNDAQVRAKALEVMKASFKERGIAKLDRLDQDETQALCSQFGAGAPPKDVAAKIEKANLESIKQPSDG
jgi:sulfur-oxidizing protein SoxX